MNGNSFINRILGVSDDKSWSHWEYINFSDITVAELSDKIATGANVNAKDDTDRMPLHHLAGYNTNTEVVKILLNAGTDVDAEDSNGHRPLDYAVENANIEAVKVLLNAGADVNAKNKIWGRTPLYGAAQNQKTFRAAIKPLSELMQHNSDSLEVIKILINSGADVQVKDSRDDTPLHLAAFNIRNPEIFKALVEIGADIRAENKDGETPFQRLRDGGANMSDFEIKE